MAVSKDAPAPEPSDDAPEVESAVDAPSVGDTGPGFRGKQRDETPNEHYTVAGVTAGKPTPETA